MGTGGRAGSGSYCEILDLCSINQAICEILKGRYAC